MWWYAVDQTSSQGPVSASDLLSLFQKSVLNEQTKIWKKGWDQWRPLGEIEELAWVCGKAPPPLQPENTSEPPPLSSPAQEKSEVSTAGPWRRFFARWIDLFVWSFVAGYGIGFLFSGFVLKIIHDYPVGHEFLFGMINIPVGLALDGLVYALFGNTLGKTLLRLSVVQEDGHPLSPAAYWSRNFSLWWRGLAFGIPFVQFVTMLYQYSRVRSGRAASWDVNEKRRVEALPLSGLRKFGVVVLIVGFLVGYGALHAHVRHLEQAHQLSPVSQNSPQESQDRPAMAAWVEMENQGLPRMLDSSTRIDRIKLGLGKTLIYEYTIVDSAKASLIQDAPPARFRAFLLNKICASAKVSPLLEQGWSLEYRYHNPDHKVVATQVISASDCPASMIQT